MTATSRPLGWRMSLASVVDDMPISDSACAAAWVGDDISATVIRSRVAASSAGTALSVNVAREAPKSVIPSPADLNDGRTPVLMAAASLFILMSPTPTMVLRYAAASAASVTSLSPVAMVPIRAWETVSMSARPMRASLLAAVRMSIAAAPRNPADSMW